MGWGGVHSVGMEQGVFAAIASFGPFTAAYFMAYEWMKTQASNLLGYDRDSLPLALNLVNGAIGGAAASILTHPMDVVKTRLQVQGISRHEIPFRNGRDAFIRILRSEGPWAFTKGATARIMWLAPNTAITIGIYEALKRIIRYVSGYEV